MADESWMHPLRQNETGFTLVTKLEVRAPDIAKYLDWLTRFMMASVESSGVLSAEMVPSPSFLKTPIWTLVERFHTAEQIEAWLKSEPHRQLMSELEPDLKRREVVLSTSRDPTAGGSISVAVVTRVKEGQEAAYFAYERQYQAAQATAPGYHGAYVQPPSKGGAGTWITILRFDSPQAMDQWFASEARHKLLAESQTFVQSTDFHPVTTSFPSWLPEEVTGEGPSNWKMALLILIGLYPSVMVVIKYVLPLLQGYPMAVNNFIGNILTVAFTTWISMPFLIYMYAAWMFSHANTPKRVHVVSLFSILIIYAIEIAFFWRFF